MNRKLCYFFLVLLFLVIYSAGAFSQEEPDPLVGKEDLAGSSEFMMIWSQVPDGGSSNKISYQKIYDYLRPLNDQDLFPIDQRIIDNKRHSVGGDSTVAQSEQIDVAAGDFNGDGYDDVVGGWQGRDSSIIIWAPQIDHISLSWEDATILKSEYKLYTALSWSSGYFRLATGDFDGDGEDEFVLVYHGADEKIHIEVFDTDGSRVPQQVGSYIDEDLPAEPSGLIALDIAVGDFNLDGRDELVLTSRDANGGTGGHWAIYVKVLELNNGSSYQLIQNARKIVMDEPVFDNSVVKPINLAITTGDYDLDTIDEIGLIFSFYKSNEENSDDTYLFMMKVSQDLESIDIPLAEGVSSRKNNGGQIEPLSIASGDVNGDGSDELVYMIGGSFYVYGTDSLLHPQYKIQDDGYGGQQDYYSNRFLGVADLDQNGRAEIIIVRNTDKDQIQQFKIRAFEVNQYFSKIETKAERLEEEPTQGSSSNNHSRNFAIATGDFDGDRVRLGRPKRHFESEISQPLVILNSPPVHFDVINDTVYDVNVCYNGNECKHSISYAKTTSGSVRISSSLSMDWGEDTTITGSAGAWGNTIERSMTNSYGNGFSINRGKSEEFSISFSAEAVTEDLIFGTVVDYVIWEYPVFADDTLRGYVAVVEPKNPTKTWFSTESWPGQSYIPNHEVGNILSYREYSNLTSNDYLSEAIKLDNGIRFGLSPTSNFEWELNWGSWTESGASQTNTIGTDAGYSWSWGLDIDVMGSVKSTYGKDMESTYEETQIETQKTTVAQDIDVKVNLGTIEDSEKRYDVTPYAYWGNNGALVVDYAARPQLAPPGQPETWWQKEYGHDVDPAFILPFRYHPEKGLNLSEDAKRHFTNDIQFFPAKASGGDTVVVVARVHNYSLLDTENPIKVRFYIGDPDNGGTMITGINGETEVATETFLQFRTSQLVRMAWRVPENIKPYSRIYAVIDPEDEIPDEIHDNNNKGYNVLGSDFATDIQTERIAKVPNRFELLQNYPNPFNPSTTIEYVLPERTDVNLRIYNVLGQHVKTLVNKQQEAGTHKITFDAGNLASGIYFYSLTVKGITMTRRFVLLK
jgi:hypothetical protein